MGLQDVSKIFKSSGYCDLGQKSANNRKAGVNFSIRLHSVDTHQLKLVKPEVLITYFGVQCV